MVLAQYGETTGSHGSHIQRVIDFAVCHLAGESAATVDCPSHDSVSDTKGTVLNCLAYLLLGCLPMSSLIFAFKSSDFNQVAVCCKRVVRVGQPEATKTNLSAPSSTRKTETLKRQQ